jgi:hypothetical protein
VTDGPATLILDIETMPAIAEIWSLWDSHIPIQRVREPGYVFGFGYAWHNRTQPRWVGGPQQDIAMSAQDLLNRADIVVTYNGDKFDFGHLNKTMVKEGCTPPSPYKSVDLYKTVKRVFGGLESYKLDYVARYLGLSPKIQTDYSLWQRCMAGDAKALAEMSRYCRHDVSLTGEVFDIVRPWIKNYPNVGFWSGPGYVCPACGSSHVQRRGYQVKIAMRYPRYQCQDCGKWSHDKAGERIATELRPA